MESQLQNNYWETLPHFKVEYPLADQEAPSVYNNEFAILNESKFPLNKSKSKHVSVGLSSSFDYKPSIQLLGNKNDYIVFNDYEWNVFLSYQGIITNYFYSNNKIDVIDAGQFSIFFETYSGVKVVKLVKNKVAVYLGYESICKLWELLPLVKYIADKRRRQQFATYFNVLKCGLRSQAGDKLVNALKTIQPLDNPNSENISTVLELIYLHPNIFERECS